MEPKSKKQKCDEEVVVRDRLSEMPDQILVHILSCMSTLDAVRTVLIRRFGNLWTLVHSLDFDFEEFENAIYTVKEPDRNNVLLRFCSFVRNVLMAHRRAIIDVFRLYIMEGSYMSVSYSNITDDLEMWLRFAVEREAKEIVFSLHGYSGYHYIAPFRGLFTSPLLVKLVLNNSIIEPRQMIMGSLRKLSLCNCEVSNETFNQLISGCPSLQELDLEYIQELQDIRITTSSVEKLRLELPDGCTLDCPKLKSLEIVQQDQALVNVIDVSSLQEVIIRDLPSDCTLCAINTFFYKFRNTVVFTLSSSAFEVLLDMEIKDFPVNRWKRLVLEPSWSKRKCLELVCQLVKSSTHLEELVISTEPSYERVLKDYDVQEPSSPFEMPQIKTVTIHGYTKCGECQLLVAKYFLKNAILLEKLIIIPGKNQPRMELKFVEEVSKLRRASINASVIFG